MAGEEAMEPLFINPILYFISIVIGFTFIAIWWIYNNTVSNVNQDPKKLLNDELPVDPPTTKHNQNAAKPNKKKAGNTRRQANAQQFQHPHLNTNLKGHSASITSGDFSSNGKHYISSSEDRTVLIWSTKDFGQRELRSVRGNIELDHATHVCWSPDSKAFIVHKATANVIEVYKVGKKSDGTLGNIQPGISFGPHDSTLDLIALGIAVSGKYIMTCDSKNQLLIWDLHGEILEAIETRHGNTYSASLSPCGRFIATTGFTPDVKVWEVKFGKAGAFEGVKRAFELKGHKSGIYSCGFNQDSTKMVSLSKDGTWRLYDTLIEYEKGQEPYLLLSGDYENKDKPGLIRLSPDGRTIALATGSDLIFYSAINGEQLYCYQDLYSGPIIDLKFDPSSKYTLTLGDKHTKVFHNVAGYHTTIQDLERSKKQAVNNAMRDRIDGQIKEAEAALKSIQEKVNNAKN